MSDKSITEKLEGTKNFMQYDNHTKCKGCSLFSRLSSYVESLSLFLISLLFATTAYAQTVPPTTFIDLEYSYNGTGNVTGIIDHIDSQKTRSMQYDNLS